MAATAATPGASGQMRRRFVRSGDRHVHYIRGGQGSPVVLVHPGIASASFMVPQIQRLAPHHTCFAFDSAGFGSSDAAANEPASIADLADGLAAAMRALGFPPVPVFGYHSGAVVALELASRHPELVSGLILDGLPIFHREEVAELFSRDFSPPLRIDELGGHFASTWTRFRDQTTFYPWCARSPEHLIPLETAPPPAVIHHWMSYFFRSGRHYVGPFRGAHTYGEQVPARLAALTVPAAFLMASSDLLAAHAERLPALKPAQRLIRLGPSADEKHEQLMLLLDQYSSPGAAPDDDELPPACRGIARHYVDLPTGQMLVRCAGDRGSPMLILLHDAPGSALALEPLIAALAATNRVYAFDLPGCGESDALPEPAPSLTSYATALQRACAQLNIMRATIYGTGFGASLAIELARVAPSIVGQLALHGVLLPTDEERADLCQHYAPPIAIEPDGSHWYRTWLMLRDSLVHWPWYRRTRAAQRRTPADFDGQHLHEWTFEVMKQIHAYPHLVNAALEHDAGAALRQLKLPILRLEDGAHRFSVYEQQLAALIPAARTELITPNPRQIADLMVAATAHPWSV
jgi:pimeloyl-ACP methyl ester carboxylesterase